jgi:hypothetical protein
MTQGGRDVRRFLFLTGFLFGWAARELLNRLWSHRNILEVLVFLVVFVPWLYYLWSVPKGEI